MSRHPAINLAALIVSVSVFGCGQDENVVIEGYVCTSEDLWQSTLMHGIHANPRYSAIEGAAAYVCYDKEKKEPIDGYRTRSDEKGMYRIALANMPHPIDSEGYYFLVIEREGYQPIVQGIKKSAIHPFTRNTAVLMPLSK